MNILLTSGVSLNLSEKTRKLATLINVLLKKWSMGEPKVGHCEGYQDHPKIQRKREAMTTGYGLGKL